MKKIFMLVCSLGLLTLAFAAPANAQWWWTSRWDNLTYLTFSGPVALPGVTLPAGTYVFRVPDPRNAWRIVQVLDKDMSIVYATLMTIPVARTSIENDVIFKESRADAPARLHVWYPSRRFNGYEFLYPEESE